MDFNDLKYLACDLPEGIKCFKYAGMYERELDAIDDMLGRDIIPALRGRLEMEKVIARGMLDDYSMTFDEALKCLRESSPLCTAADLERLIADGRADWRLRGGEIRFQDSFVSSAHINAGQLLSHTEDKPLPKPERPDYLVKMKRDGKLSLRHHIRHTIWPEEGAQNAGERILCHIPLPIVTGEQSNVVIHEMSPGGYVSEAAQRTVSFDTVYKSGMEFFIDYSFDVTQTYHEADPSKVIAAQPADFTGEEYPHIRFTPYIKELCGYLTADESNPLLKARRIYDYITKNVRYSYMREYLCLDNIPEFAALNLRGDCGVQALLFITLCRCAGIGAQWQSGLNIHGGYITSHDWARYYIAPFGWLYADLSRGGGAIQSGDTELWDFSFCNIDPMRMAANSSFQSEFDPPKKHTRIDPYDNQSGEIEYEGRGLVCGEVGFRREILETVEL